MKRLFSLSSPAETTVKNALWKVLIHKGRENIKGFSNGQGRLTKSLDVEECN